MPDDALNLRDLCCPFVLDGQKGHVFEVTFQRLLPNPCDRRATWSIRYTSMWALLRQALAAWWLSRMTAGSIGRTPWTKWSERSVSRPRPNRSSPRPRLPLPLHLPPPPLQPRPLQRPPLQRRPLQRPPLQRRPLQRPPLPPP